MTSQELNFLDYEHALHLLMPFREQLEIIKKAELNEEFETIDSNDPWDAITYFRNTEAYTKYQISKLSETLYDVMKQMKKVDYTIEEYMRIQELTSTTENGYYEDWTLNEVYLYLQMIFEDLKYDLGKIDSVIIENCVINGDLLEIINCFIYRI